LAVVSAGASGIGLATAEAFLGEGYTCLVLDQDRDALARVHARLGGIHGDRVVTLCADLLADDKEAITSLLARYPDHSLHLVNNLGGSSGPRRPLEVLRWTDFEDTLRFNLKATFELTGALSAPMRAKGRGWIVNVASIAGRTAHPYVGAD